MKKIVVISIAALAMCMPQLAAAKGKKLRNILGGIAAGVIIADHVVNGSRHDYGRRGRHRGNGRHRGYGGHRGGGKFKCVATAQNRRFFFKGKAKGWDRHNVKRQAIQQCKQDVRYTMGGRGRPRKVQRLKQECRQTAWCERIRGGGRHRY